MVGQDSSTEGQDHAPIHDLDSLLKPLGGFGKFQIINLVCICSMIILCACSELGYVFTAGQVKHRCLVSECESSNASWAADQSWLSAAIPVTSSGDWDSCRRYKHNDSIAVCSNASFTAETNQCNVFVYETEEWTIVREDWDLQCDDGKYLLSLVGSLNNVGQVVGALSVGYLSDRFGRKLVIVTLTILVAILGLIKSFSVGYAMMVAFEIVEAVMVVALFNGPFVLALEIVDPSKRVLAAMIASMAYPLGEMILGFVQYLTFDWRTTIRILYTPFFLVISFYWIIPESVRWLLTNDRPDEAVAVLRTIAKTNGKKLPEQAVRDILTQEANRKVLRDDKNSNKFLELWQSKRMRIRVIFCLFVWLCNTFVFFGMTMNSVSISSDKFLNFILTGLIEIPAYVLIYLVLDRWGRRICQSGFLLLCGLACLLDAFIPDDDTWSWAQLVLYLIGKFAISISFFVIDVYTTEMFPTDIRSTMMSIGLMSGKLATILAPEVPLLGDVYEPLPLLLFGGMAIAGGLMSITFPETLDCKLPDTMEEAENLGLDKRKPKSNNSLPP